MNDNDDCDIGLIWTVVLVSAMPAALAKVFT